jgi:hypothetical protein
MLVDTAKYLSKDGILVGAWFPLACDAQDGTFPDVEFHEPST